MKKKIALFLSLVLLCASAFAEGPDDPTLKNPRERYEMYVDKTDGSEDLIYGVLDAINDEAEAVAEHGSLTVRQSYIDETGMEIGTFETTLLDSEYGRMMRIFQSGLAIYVWGTHYYATFLNFVVDSGEMFTQEEFDWQWESYHFPFGSLEVLHGVRQDDAGYSYFLVKSNDGYTFEFVVGENMSIEQIRLYRENEQGEICLDMIVRYEYGTHKDIPATVLAAVQKDFAAESGN